MRETIPAVLAAIALAGCLEPDYGPWVDSVSYWGTWADDGSSILVARLDYEQRSVIHNMSCDGCNVAERRNQTYELSVAPAAATNERQTLASGIPGENVTNFYFMKTRGYVVIDESGDDKWIDVATGEIHSIDPARLGFSEEVELLPSPDGRWIAAVQVVFDEGRDQLHTSVTLFDAPDGEARFAPRAVPLEGSPRSFAWSVEDTLKLNMGDDRWFEVTSIGDVRSIPPEPACYTPTTSSNVNADGQRVDVNGEGIVSISEPGTSVAWPCR